jgi:hypothetical protein
MTRRLFALGAVLLLTAAAPPDDHGRPVILLVHGRGMADRDSAATRKLWLEALTSGLKTVTRDSLIAERDVRVVWYADVLDPRSNAGCDYDRGDVRAHHDATQDPDLKSFASLAGNLIGSLSSLVADTEMMAQLRGLASDAAFLSDARKRCASERRVADAIEQDAIAGPVGLGHDVPANPPADEPDPHEMVGYLRGSITAKEVLNGWCAAFQSTSRPPGCRELVPK